MCHMFVTHFILKLYPSVPHYVGILNTEATGVSILSQSVRVSHTDTLRLIGVQYSMTRPRFKENICSLKQLIPLTRTVVEQQETAELAAL